MGRRRVSEYIHDKVKLRNLNSIEREWIVPERSLRQFSPEHFFDQVDVRRHERPRCARGRHVCPENKRVGVFLRDAFERFRHVHFLRGRTQLL
jgi:hypothetical protein